MASPTEVYVDPAIAASSGSGTIGDPYGDLQYAFNTKSRDTTNGDRFNIKSGTAEVMSATLDLTTYGSPTAAAPCILQGYTSSAGDGGIGSINCNNTQFWGAAKSYLQFRDLNIYGSGSNIMIVAGYGFVAINCEFNQSTNELLRLGQVGYVSGCHFHDGLTGVRNNAGSGTLILGNYFKNDGSTDFGAAIELVDPAEAIGNIISIDGTSDGIRLWDHSARAIGNSILSAGGTGQGIQSAFTPDVCHVLNNLIEGFSGSGGIGIDLTSGTILVRGGNAIYNCATAYNVTIDTVIDLGGDETLGASPFAKSGSDTFANRFTYFSPADTGNVQGGAYPVGCLRDKGAVQHADPSGGGGTVILSRPRRLM